MGRNAIRIYKGPPGRARKGSGRGYERSSRQIGAFGFILESLGVGGLLALAGGLFVLLKKGSSPTVALTADQLVAVMPQLPYDQATNLLPYLNDALSSGEINTPARIAAFLAQVALETNGLTMLTEIWGPTKDQLNYSWILGNQGDADGLAYRGRGALQLTGKQQYQDAGDAIGVDIVNNPERAADLDVAFKTAVWDWTRHGTNAYADVGDFDSITRAINCGNALSTCSPNGVDQRNNYWVTAKAVLGVDSNQA